MIKQKELSIKLNCGKFASLKEYAMGYRLEKENNAGISNKKLKKLI